MKKKILTLGLISLLSACSANSNYKEVSSKVISQYLRADSVTVNELYSVAVKNANADAPESISICGRFSHENTHRGKKYDNHRFVLVGHKDELKDGSNPEGRLNKALFVDDLNSNPSMMGAKDETNFEASYWNNLCVDDDHSPHKTAKAKKPSSYGLGASGWSR